MFEQKYKLIVFDWDGTLNNSVDHIANCIRESFREVDLPIPSISRARHVIGLGLQDAMDYLNPGMSNIMIKRVAGCYKEHFLALKPKIELFPGVSSGLKKLKDTGFLLAISTGKTKAGLENDLDQHRLKNFFNATRCADEDKPKPDPAMLRWLMDYSKVKPEETLMVGDTTHDLSMGNQINVDALGVSYGAHTCTQLLTCSPVQIVETPKDMFTWILRNS